MRTKDEIVASYLTVGAPPTDLRKSTSRVNSDLRSSQSNGRVKRFRKSERRSSGGNKSPAFQLGPLLVSDNRASSGRAGYTAWTADRCRERGEVAGRLFARIPASSHDIKG